MQLVMWHWGQREWCLDIVLRGLPKKGGQRSRAGGSGARGDKGGGRRHYDQ